METGIYITVRLRLIQLFKLPLALKFSFEKNEEGYNAESDVTSFAELCTALAATTSCSYAS
jgi:AGCS family alanine or glycine:cation symporter